MDRRDFFSLGCQRRVFLFATLAFLSLLAPQDTRAQFTASYQTNIISGVSSNWSGGYIVGQNYIYDTLFIQNGGVLQDGSALIGFAVGADNNSAVISGSGSVWSNQSTLVVGYNGSDNQLIITNGGALVSSDSYVGDFSSSNNMVLVSGPGSVWKEDNHIFLGQSGWGNSLIITKGGAVFNNSDGELGTSSGSSNNMALVSDGGSFWSIGGTLFVGDGGSGNNLTVANGGHVANALTYIGNAVGSSKNSVLITDTGSSWSNSIIFVGVTGSGNLLTITNGGQVVDGDGVIGNDPPSSSNAVVVTGAGSLWNNSVNLEVGSTGSGNSMTVVNGGKVINGQAIIGYISSSNNSVLVSGSGSIWSNNGVVFVGRGGPGNSLTVANGGVVQAWDLDLGLSVGSAGNAVNIINGNLVVSNGVGTGSLEVHEGTLTLNGGSVTVDSLLMTNTLGQLEFQAGSLAIKSTMYANGQGFSVGSGTGVSTLNLSGGSHIFSNGFAIADTSTSTGAVWITSGNVTVRGDNTIIGNAGVGQMTISNGMVTADPTYGFRVGQSSGSQGTLTIAGGSVTGNLCLACGSGSAGTVWVTGGQLSSEPMDIGDSGIGQMTVSNGTVISGSTYNSVVGFNPGSVGTLTVAGGNMLLSGTLLLGSESGATGVVWITGGQLNVSQLTIGVSGQGILTLSNGTITVSQLAVTNGLSSILNLIGGTLNTASTVLQNNYQFLVGDGIYTANFHLRGGVHSFANGLRITSNSLLTGCGTINGSVVVDPGGTVITDCGGTLTFTGIVTNNGTMQPINGSVLEAYGTVVNNGTIDITAGTTNFHGVFINNGTIIGGATTNCTPGVNWTQATPAAQWSARAGVRAMALTGQMWMIGSGSLPLNDVWSSSNGVNWVQATSAAQWSPRSVPGAVVFNGQMWVLGGYNGGSLNDVWSSSNGVDWVQATSAAPWPARHLQGVVVFNGQMWVMGGAHNASPLNDVWSSSNGVDWVQATSAAPWSVRWLHGVVVYNGQMWVMGGSNGSSFLNDVWSSSNGVNWVQATSAAPWLARQDFGIVALDGQMWVLGGGNGGFLNDVWSSSNGVNWVQATSAAQWSPRSGLGAVTLNEQMWVLGGENGSGVLNDVWFSGCGRFQITAIAKQGNDILVTWTGSGGQSNILQSTKRAAIASYNTNFTDISPLILLSGVGASTTNYLDPGVAYAPILPAPSGNNVSTSVVPSMVDCSGADTRGITDSLGRALPIGSLLMLGSFSISEPNIQSNFFAGNVAAIMSNFTAYSTAFKVGDGTSLPASWSVTRSAAGFDGQQIYLLAIDKPTFAAATHLGIFTAPSWVFPSGGGTNTIDLADVTDFVIGAQSGPLTINLPVGGATYTFDDTARLNVLPGRILFYRVRQVP